MVYVSQEGFSEKKPWRAMVYEKGNEHLFAFAGEPERIIRSADISTKEKEKLLVLLKKETDKGSRVVGYAYKSKGNNALEKKKNFFPPRSFFSNSTRGEKKKTTQ